MDWPGRITILEDLLRRLARSLADLDARLRRAEQNLQQVARSPQSGGGGGVKPQAWVIIPSGGVPGASKVSPGGNLDREPSEFTAIAWEASSSGLSPVDGGALQSLRWWGWASLFAGETLPLVRAADGAFEIAHRHTIAIGKVKTGTGSGDPYQLNEMAEIINAYSQVEFQNPGPPPYSTANTQVTIPSVWAVGPYGKTTTTNENVMVHLLTDICYFHKL